MSSTLLPAVWVFAVGKLPGTLGDLGTDGSMFCKHGKAACFVSP